MPVRAVERVLYKHMGLNAGAVSPSLVERVCRRRMQLCGVKTLEEYAARLEIDPGEIQALVEAVAVPETWFFRDPEAYTAMAAWVRREWLPRHATDTLRVLSIPCSTGEEPYSIAIRLLEEGIPAGRYRIDAVDISQTHLNKATEGVYSTNSFRRFPNHLLQKYFTETIRGRQVIRDVRNQVEFRKGNVLQAGWAPIGSRYDMIFCRNLLIYFDAPTQERAIITLDGLLRCGGVLFVGSAEAFLARSFGYVSLEHPMSFGYLKSVEQRAKGRVGKTEPRRNLPVVSPKPAAKVSRLPQEPAAAAPVFPKSVKAAAEVVPALSAARAAADAGEFKAARAACLDNLAHNGPSAEAYFLLGLIADSEDQNDQAIEFYRKSLYLDPQYQEALAHLALLLEKQGETESSRRLLERAKRAQRTYKPGETGVRRRSTK